jgi:hypothetical protein
VNNLRKGVTHDDGTYEYTCGCGFKDSNCAYCYGGDLARCQEAIKTARGQIYYGLLKTILSHVGKTLKDEVRAFKASGKFTPIDMGYLSLKYGLNFKATSEWLEECGAVKAGSYEMIQRGGLKVKDIYAAAREKYELVDGLQENRVS